MPGWSNFVELPSVVIFDGIYNLIEAASKIRKKVECFGRGESILLSVRGELLDISYQLVLAGWC